MERWEKSMPWKHLYWITFEGVQENVVILNVTTFCVQTKESGNIKFYCPIITSFES